MVALVPSSGSEAVETWSQRADRENCIWEVLSDTYIGMVTLTSRLEVGSQVHGHLVLGAQQRTQHGVGGNTHATQRRALELPTEVQYLQFQVLNLQGTIGAGLTGGANQG